MNIYKLNRLIVIEKRTTSMDAIGNEIREWNTHYKCHATISNLSGTEHNQDGQKIPRETLYFIVRGCNAVKAMNTADYRIIFDSKIYDIKFIDKNNIERGYIKIDTEVAQNGNKD